jgi:hypothetical protein
MALKSLRVRIQSGKSKVDLLDPGSGLLVVDGLRQTEIQKATGPLIRDSWSGY